MLDHFAMGIFQCPGEGFESCCLLGQINGYFRPTTFHRGLIILIGQIEGNLDLVVPLLHGDIGNAKEHTVGLPI